MTEQEQLEMIDLYTNQGIAKETLAKRYGMGFYEAARILKGKRRRLKPYRIQSRKNRGGTFEVFIRRSNYKPLKYLGRFATREEAEAAGKAATE